LYLLRNDDRLDKQARDEVFRPLQEEIQTARKLNKTLQKQNLFAGIAKRMNHSHTGKLIVCANVIAIRVFGLISTIRTIRIN